jgi:hypothetical protein
VLRAISQRLKTLARIEVGIHKNKTFPQDRKHFIGRGLRQEEPTVSKKGLREQLIGAWKLISYVESPVDGSAKRFPMGDKAQGIIMYTPDGWRTRTVRRQTNFIELACTAVLLLTH